MITMSHFPSLENGENGKNNNGFVGWLRRLNDLVVVPHLEQELDTVNAIY